MRNGVFCVTSYSIHHMQLKVLRSQHIIPGCSSVYVWIFLCDKYLLYGIDIMHTYQFLNSCGSAAGTKHFISTIYDIRKWIKIKSILCVWNATELVLSMEILCIIVVTCDLLTLFSTFSINGSHANTTP